MKLSELYEHKSSYDDMIKCLKGYESLPGFRGAIIDLEHVVSRCAHYEKWHIDLPYWDDGLSFAGVDVYTGQFTEIPNQIWDEDMTSHSLLFQTPQSFLKIRFPTGPYLFGDDYPRELFDEFFCELKKSCPPGYEDMLNNSLYYRVDDASKAYDTCRRLYKEYRDKYMSQSRDRKIKKLEDELSRLMGEAGGESK